MTYVKKGAMVFLVDDDKVPKYTSDGFVVYDPEATEAVESKDIFKCHHCEKEYKSQSALDKHIKEKHPEGDGVDA